MSAHGVRGTAVSGSFRESVLFSVLIVFAGLVIEATTGGRGISLPQWPSNGIALALFFAGIVGTALSFREKRFVAWLGGIPLGISLIMALALLSFIGGVLPQEEGSGPLWARMMRLNGMFSSWPFALTVIFFLVNLGLSLVWKTVPFRFANLQFILFHAGFWIALSCGLVGAADLQRVIIPLYEGRSTSRGYDTVSKSTLDLPFSLHLEDFEMKQYSPQLALYDPGRDRLVPDDLQHVQDIAEGFGISWDTLSVRVERFLPHAMLDGAGEPVAADSAAGVPYVRVSGTSGRQSFSGWVSTGSPFEAPAFISVGERLIVLVPGSPKKYRSSVIVRRGAESEGTPAVLEVNRPVDVMGWKLYQMGYDEKAGRWSTLSLVEGVRDPWLPFVYIGFFMILAGNALFFWKGMKKTRVL